MKNLVVYLLFFTTLFSSSNENFEFEIKLKSEKFIPEVTVNYQRVLDSRLMEKQEGQVYRLIQFYSIPTKIEKERIAKAGIELISYIPNKAYFAKFPSEISNASLALLNIRSLLIVEDKFKLSPLLTSGRLPGWAISADAIKLKVKYYSKEDTASILEFLPKNNGKLIGAMEEVNVLFVEYPYRLINDLAKHPFIQWIEPISQKSTPDDILGRSSSRSNTLDASYSGGRKYDGAGVVVAVCDDGIVGPHIDFQGRIVSQYTSEDLGSHGDMTAGIFVGAGNLDPTIKGMATASDIHIYKVATNDLLGYPHILNAVDHLNDFGTVITSTSYSQGQGGEYTSETEFIDQQINLNQNIIHVFSAGNSGTFDHGYGAGQGWGNITGGMKAGKNVICSGNVNHLDQLLEHSSRGPAEDGRIKPDLCAHGFEQMSTNQNNAYLVGGGTSAAAPTIAGVTAQLYQAYRINNGGLDPETALLKASLLNTAEDLGNPGPDFQHGWGRINGLKAVRIIEEERYITDFIGQSDLLEHEILVPSNVSEVRIMCYWMDVAGNPASSISLVNDIDMTVLAPNDQVHRPLVLNPTPVLQALNAIAVEGVDHLNNVEQVRVNNPEEGIHTVSLEGFAIPQGPQKFYLVYDFIYDEVELTAPIGGEAYAHNDHLFVRWDASVGTENFTLEYSLDGGVSYSTISQTISPSERSYDWQLPDIISDNVKIRISRGNSSSESHTRFTIVDVPKGLRVERVCPDTIQLTWALVEDVPLYEVSMLGEKYMDSIGVSSSNTFTIADIDGFGSYWFSVKSVLENGKGRRAKAIRHIGVLRNCEKPYDIGIVEALAPEGSMTNCRNLESSSVIVQIQNFGLMPVSDIPVSYQLNQEDLVTEIYAGPILPGESYRYKFEETIDISQLGDYLFAASIEVPLDGYRYNDNLSTNFEVTEGMSVGSPHLQNFNTFSTCELGLDSCAVDCDLSAGYMNLKNSKLDDIDWRVRKGSSPFFDFNESGTFVGDYDLNGEGNYLYLESYNGCTFKEGKLISPCIQLTDSGCANVEFAYLMNGNEMGELHIDVKSPEGLFKDVHEPILGDQGAEWKTVSIDLSAFSGESINLIIRGITGPGAKSVIIIDAISLVSESGVAAFEYNATSQDNSFFFKNTSTGNVLSSLWDFGDGDMSVSANTFHTYDFEGDYDVTLIVEGACGFDTTVQTLNVGTTAVLDPQDLNSKIKLYPNPTNGKTTLQLPVELLGQEMGIKLVDVFGHVLLNIEKEKAEQLVDLDLSDLVDGVYIVVLNGLNFQSTKKLVKQF